jgi:hypothetical protein
MSTSLCTLSTRSTNDSLIQTFSSSKDINPYGLEYYLLGRENRNSYLDKEGPWNYTRTSNAHQFLHTSIFTDTLDKY